MKGPIHQRKPCLAIGVGRLDKQILLFIALGAAALAQVFISTGDLEAMTSRLKHGLIGLFLMQDFHLMVLMQAAASQESNGPPGVTR